MKTIEKIVEGFQDGVENGRWPISMIKGAFGQAGVNAVGTDTTPELRKNLNKVIEEREDKSYGILGKASYCIGYVFGYLT